MTERVIKLPNPDHPITIEPTAGRVVVKAGGQVIADSREALTLREASYPPVQYIPRKDLNLSLVARTDHATYCPYKGEASYFSIPAGGERAANAIWSYETPFPAMAQIEGYVAFYPDRVDSVEVL